MALIKSRKATDAKLDYSHITVKFEVWSLNLFILCLFMYFFLWIYIFEKP